MGSSSALEVHFSSCGGEIFSCLLRRRHRDICETDSPPPGIQLQEHDSCETERRQLGQLIRLNNFLNPNAGIIFVQSKLFQCKVIFTYMTYINTVLQTVYSILNKL